MGAGSRCGGTAGNQVEASLQSAVSLAVHESRTHRLRCSEQVGQLGRLAVAKIPAAPKVHLGGALRLPLTEVEQFDPPQGQGRIRPAWLGHRTTRFMPHSCTPHRVLIPGCVTSLGARTDAPRTKVRRPPTSDDTSLDIGRDMRLTTSCPGA